MARRSTVRKVEEAQVETVSAVEVAAPATQYPTQEQLVADGFSTTSARIRELARLGAKTGEIAKILTNGKGNIRYQHVRNVLATPLKRPAKAAAEVEATS